MTDDTCDCEYFSEGDWVESKLNSNVFGIVVGESDFGRYYHVQLADTLEIRAMYGVTIRHMDVQDDEPPVAAKQPVADNVIQVDFTKRRPLKPNTTTEGAA
ncbi:hypothetical protein HFO15_19600 [Rhizobium laguerreae]|uniref:hypothetical protein n=1 Tax=Rhizobium laguerreae TaxID=1076926 RepID=UPI001C8FF642|nr:hypothetical protein [Rhizobium laguerreae]MBY3263834.1 hypothetical protein [Rhizobium laguerreae]